MNKKIMLIMFTLLISFMCIGVRADEPNLPELDLFENADSTENKTPEQIIEDTDIDDLKNSQSKSNYFTGTDGTKGDYLGCVYKGKHATMILKARYYQTGNVQIEHADSGGSLDVQWKNSLTEWIKENKSCPKAAVIYDYDGYFGSSSKSGKTYEKYNECLNSGGECYWLDFDYSFASNDVSDLSTFETEKSGTTDTDVYDFMDKYQQDRDYTEETVKVTSGCGLFSSTTTEYIQKALFYTVLAGIIITIVMGLIDFIKAVTGIEDKGMSKAWQRFLKRIISLAVLIILPSLVAFLLTSLDLKGVNEGSIFCGIVEE